MFFAHKKLNKTPQKIAYLWQLGDFFSAAPTAQNSPELHLRSINYFIQSSLLRSLMKDKDDDFANKAEGVQKIDHVERLDQAITVNAIVNAINGNL